MTDCMNFQKYLDSFRSEGFSDAEARKRLKKEAKELFDGRKDLFEKYAVSDAGQAMRKADKILAWLKNDALTLSGTDFTDVPESELTDTIEGDFTYTAAEKKASYDRIFHDKYRNRRLRILMDGIKNFFTYFFSIVSIIVLVGIIYYCFSTGGGTFSWGFITGKNQPERVSCSMPEDMVVPEDSLFTAPEDLDEDSAFSTRWGVVFTNSETVDGAHTLVVTYVDSESPFHDIVDKEGNRLDYTSNFEIMNLSGFSDSNTIVAINPTSDNAQEAAKKCNRIKNVYDAIFEIGGNGIRGPLIATLWMILFALVFSLPLGIGGAIYLAVYAKKNQITNTLRTMIDMISGIPSIIFGLAGAIIFIPIFSGGSGLGNILSGAATLACMVLPTIMKNTEEAINVIPSSLKSASLALGASQTQTVFKVILPNSVPGILTGGLLAVGRIIGESAALIFATGASIQDTVSPTTESPATLAVYIWKSVTGQENPNYKAAAAAAILILVVVLILNITVKLIATKLDKFSPKAPKSWIRKKIEKWIQKEKDRRRIREGILKPMTKDKELIAEMPTEIGGTEKDE